jgi:TatD DNase family protein
MELIDTHCHLADRAFAADRDEVIARAWASGLVGLVCVGYDLRSSRAALRLAERDDRIRVAVGVHPHYAGEVLSGARAGLDAFVAELRSLARHPKVVAVGETGLDFFRDLSPRQAQRDVFRRHIAVAQELDLPLIVHDREAHAETVGILRESYDGRPPGGVMHCFSGDTHMAKACLELGFAISFAGPITYPKSDRSREVALAVPADRILIETDCPYLPPQAHRGRRNEPAYVGEVARELAGVRRTTPEEMASATAANARRVFRLG